MQVTFHFSNGESTIILSPENARDKTYLSLCVEGKSNISWKPTKDDSIAISFHYQPINFEEKEKQQ